MDSEMVERMASAYRNAWLEQSNQALIFKTQLDVLNEKYAMCLQKIAEQNEQIEALQLTRKAAK